ncbi:hypothetical protein BS47DRAFT_1344550 [Hydnum rufescens UP504]|uniref:Uncharacterized protein n=1 Tax=Hydnum rufescens UP504 TaxID=1448309 RepID=A0A9P6AWX2_9AGAM|nr:hypothetical protein BS47DRAFT_1344550 [Hydnum rufescens UP504]
MGALLLAGAGSFYFAKKEIDARRRLQNEAGTRPIEKRNCELTPSSAFVLWGDSHVCSPGVQGTSGWTMCP